MRAVLLLLLVLTACTGPGPAPPRPARSAPPPAKTEAPNPASKPPPSEAPLLGTTEKPVEPAVAQPPQPTVDPQTWRPQWWIAAPTRGTGVVSAAAFADAASVLDARKAAVDAGRAALTGALNAEPTGLTIARYASLRLPSGAYRAFVLVTSP